MVRERATETNAMARTGWRGTDPSVGSTRRGASFQTKRIVDAVTTSFNSGDCGFDFDGHHGTPNQRAAAATWGAELAQSARPQGKILSAETLFDLFEAELPSIVAPDAG